MPSYQSWDYDKYDELIKKAAPVDYERFRAQIWTESKFDPMAISGSDARGLGQLLPGTFNDMMPDSQASDIFSPGQSVSAASKYMTTLMGWFDEGKNESDDYNTALAAYNAGPGNVAKALEKAGIKKSGKGQFDFEAFTYADIEQYLPRETRNYVSQINDIAEHPNMPKRAIIVDKMRGVVDSGAKMITGAQDAVDAGVNKIVDLVAVLGQFKNEPILIPIYIGLAGFTLLTGYFTIKAAFEGKSKGLGAGFVEGLGESASLLNNTIKTTKGILK